MTNTTQSTEWVELGYISGLSGVRGWVKLYSYTRPRENIKQYRQFFVEADSEASLEFTDIKSSGKHIIGKVKSVDDRNQAELLLGKKLWVRASELKKTKGEYFWHELTGLTVTNQQGVTLGVVTELMETGANDVLVVKSTTDDESTVLIPYVMDYYILEVDLDNKTMTVDWETDWLED